jgi:LacI family transcriptional regulator
MKAPSPNSPVTQKDVAAALGIALGTVSMALRNDPRISLSRRQEVQKTAQRMGYHPNPAATALAHHKQASTVKPVQAALAWLNFWPDPGALRKHREFDLYWQGAKITAEKFGYRLEEFVCNEHMSVERLEKILVSRGIEGILLPPHTAHPDWEHFHWELFSIVRFGRSITTPKVLVVTADQVANIMLAFQQIRELGYERIGFVAEPAYKKWHLFEAGYLMAQQSVPIKRRLPIFRVERGNPLLTSQEKLERWLKKENPDAVLTTISETHEMLAAAGLRVPEDIGLAAMSVLDGNADTGIYQNSEEIGRTAALSLISLIHDHDRGPSALQRELLVKGRWVNGSMLSRNTTPAATGPV